MAKSKRKLTAAEKAEKKRRKEEYETIFINGKQKRIKRPPTIDGMDVDEYIRRNADPIWLHQNEMWEYINDDEEEDKVYFTIFLRDPKYPVIVISGNDIYPAFNIKELGDTCYSVGSSESLNEISVVDSTGEEFYYFPDTGTLTPGIGCRKWAKKNFINLFNQSSTAQRSRLHYAPKSLSNKRVSTIVIEICTMLATANH